MQEKSYDLYFWLYGFDVYPYDEGQAMNCANEVCNLIDDHLHKMLADIQALHIIFHSYEEQNHRNTNAGVSIWLLSNSSIRFINIS